MRCVAKLSRASTLENCAQSTSAKFHFIPNQPTNKSANQTVWGDDCGPGRMLGPVFVRVRDSLDSTPSGKSPSSHHAAAKKTHASTQATINGSRSARHAQPLASPVLSLFSHPRGARSKLTMYFRSLAVAVALCASSANAFT